jgi:hypothetical protein
MVFVYPPNGRRLIVAGNPSDNRAQLNAIAIARRLQAEKGPPR